MSFTFDKEAAKKAGTGAYILTSGVYTGIITDAIVFTTGSGAGGVEFIFESCDGEKANYLKVYTKNKDGSDNFAKGKIHALMGLLGLSTVEAKKEEDKTTIPAFCNRKIAVVLQKEEYFKSNGDVGFKFEVLHFLDFQTLKTYKEFSENVEAKTHLRKIVDKQVSGSSIDQSLTNKNDIENNTFVNDDLPSLTNKNDIENNTFVNDDLPF